MYLRRSPSRSGVLYEVGCGWHTCLLPQKNGNEILTVPSECLQPLLVHLSMNRRQETKYRRSARLLLQLLPQMSMRAPLLGYNIYFYC